MEPHKRIRPMTIRCVKAFLWTYGICAVMASIVGCAAARMVYTNTSYGSHGQIMNVEEVEIIPPKDALVPSYFTIGVDGSKAIGLSGAQSKADFAKVTGANKGKLVLYGVAGLICLAGAVMLGWSRFSNKEALEVLGAGAGMIALLYWLPATVKYMAFIIPLLLIGVVGYIVYYYMRTKQTEEPISPPA